MVGFPSINRGKRDALFAKPGKAPEIPLLLNQLEGLTGTAPLTTLATPAVVSALRADWEKAIGKATVPASKDEQAVATATDLMRQRNLVLEGVAGTGKTYLIEQIAVHLRHLFQTTRPREYLDRIRIAIGNRIDTLLEVEHADLNGAKSLAARADSLSRLMADMDALVRGLRGTVKVIVLHPSASYEELVMGLRPVPAAAGDVPRFRPTAGELLTAILDACDSWIHGTQPGPHLVVLDEINRCNLPAVLGELMLLIDSSRRLNEVQYQSVGKLRTEENTQQLVEKGLGVRMRHLTELDGYKHVCSGDLLFVPENVYVLGTMNSSDRSILGFDQALRRRFPPKRVEPYTLMQWQKALVALPSTLDPRCLGVLATEIIAWSALNAALRARIGPDAMIGHSYLFSAVAHVMNNASVTCNSLIDTLSNIWRFDVLPQVIHAAESAREEKFAQQLFEAPDPTKDGIWKGKEKVLQNSLKAVGVNDPDLLDFTKLLIEAGVGSLSLARTHLVVNVGSGHGQRLLIEKIAREPHPLKGDIKVICSAADYKSIGDVNSNMLRFACELLDRVKDGELSKRCPALPTKPQDL